MQKQTDRLMAYLDKNKTITPMQGWNDLGIYRLSDTVYKLRKSGVAISTKVATVKNRFNESCRVAKYVLECK